MTPGKQVQKLLGEVPSYEAADILTLLPLVAALHGALNMRLLAFQRQAAMPDTDYMLRTDEIAVWLSKSTKWAREHVNELPFAFRVGQDHRFSARGLEQWIAQRQAARMALALPPTRRQYER